MAFPYPPEVSTLWEKTRYIFRAKEKLRLLHNAVGIWKNLGITQGEWDSGINYSETLPEDIERFYQVPIPNGIKTQLGGYVAQISQGQYNWFRNNWHTNRKMMVEVEMLKGRKALLRTLDYDPDLDDIE
jgi:hypothetical protein